MEPLRTGAGRATVWLVRRKRTITRLTAPSGFMILELAKTGLYKSWSRVWGCVVFGDIATRPSPGALSTSTISVSICNYPMLQADDAEANFSMREHEESMADP